MSDNTKPPPDRKSWNKACDAFQQAQQKIMDNLSSEDEMERNYHEPTLVQVISQCENEKSPLTDDERSMIETMYEHGIKCDLSFGEFCNKYHGYYNYDDQCDDEYDEHYVPYLEGHRVINNIDSSK